MRNKSSNIAENPFYGKQALHTLANTAKVSTNPYEISNLLATAWNECKGNKVLREGFHATCFANSEISNRQHNAFGKHKKDDGGNAVNVFYVAYLNWLLANDAAQFIAFIPLFTEYVGFRELLEVKVKTKKNSKTVLETTGILPKILKNKTVSAAFIDYCRSVVQNGTEFQRHQLAKFTHIPRFSSRKKVNKAGENLGRRVLQPETRLKMSVYREFVNALSTAVGWENSGKYEGFKPWKRQYQKDIVDYMFSTKKVLELDEMQFQNFLQASPQGQLYKVRRMLFDKDGNSKGEQWTKLMPWFKAWEQSKLDAQALSRELEAKAKLGTLSQEEQEQLVIAKKEAKVNVGGKTLFDYVNELVMGNSENEIVLENIVNKVKFDVPVLPIVDCSGSMTGFPIQIARLFTTLALLKNPHEHGENLFLKFGSSTMTVCDGALGLQKQNRFVVGKEVTVEKVVDKRKSFSQNFQQMKQLIQADMGGTAFNNVAETMKTWVDSDADLKEQRIEMIKAYQVIMVISDGDFNGLGNAVDTILNFKSKMKAYFGWDGVILIWDTPQREVRNSKFKDVDGVLHITTFNMSVINQIFCNIHDLDIIDVYLPLKAVHASNRYELVLARTL